MNEVRKLPTTFYDLVNKVRAPENGALFSAAPLEDNTEEIQTIVEEMIQAWPDKDYSFAVKVEWAASKSKSIFKMMKIWQEEEEIIRKLQTEHRKTKQHLREMLKELEANYEP